MPDESQFPEIDGICDSFERARRSGDATPLDAWLPEDTRLRSAVLVELVRVELQLRLAAGESARAEEYLDRFPHLRADPDRLLRVVASEYQQRRRSEVTLGADEYRDRFPQLVAHPDWNALFDRGAATPGPTVPPPGGSPGGELPAIPGYEVLAVLGRGGMGIVYRARDLSLQRTVALKMLHSGAATPEELARFRAEAEAVARLQHPNVVTIHQTGEWQGQPWIAMEYLDGGRLDQSAARSPPTPRQVAEWAQQLARGVDAAHQRGVLHRDLKPANVLLTADGTPKVTDFGLAKRFATADGTTTPEGPAQTQTGAILGTPAYMAPEQAAGKVQEVGPAADVYALGAILYELLTGRPPFRGKTPADTLMQVLRDDPVPPRRLRRDVPRDLETICLKCLHKAPSRRYASAGELADDLGNFLAGTPVRARPVGAVERAVKWARRRPAAATLVGSVFVLLVAAAAAGLWYWNAYHRVRVEYFANLVKRQGVPEGVGPISAAQAGARTVSYRFSRRAGRVEAVEVVNGTGALTGEHALEVPIGDFAPPEQRVEARRECRYEYRRNERGELTEEVAYDRAGEVVWTLHYTKPTVAHFTDRRGLPTARAGSGAAYLELVWDDDGHLREEWYLDRFGNRRPGEHGVWGMRREVDARGLPVRLTLLDATGGPAVHRHGFAAVERSYDEQGNLTRETYLGADGTPALHKDRFCHVAMTYDANGNMTERAYFGANGEPVTASWGYHRFTRAFDPRGNIAECSCWGLDGRPANTLGPLDGFARYTCRYDGRGNRTEIRYFGVDGRPTLSRGGVHRATAGFDARGNRVELAYFGLDDRPTLSRNWAHRATFAYDGRGNEIEVAYFDPAGRRALHRDGFTRLTREYDGQGNQTRTAYFGPDGKPAWHRNGYAWFTHAYDERGNKVGEAYFGLDGAPIGRAHVPHRAVWAYDERGNQVEEAYFDEAGKPAWRDGYSRVKMAYDKRGHLTERAYFEPAGQPWDLIAPLPISSSLKKVYHGPDGKPAWHPNGYVRLTQETDDRGNVVATAYFGPGNRPVLRGGAVRWTARYDARGNRTEQVFFGPDDKPPTDGPVARTCRTYDAANNLIAEAFFTADGKPAANRDGIARTAVSYDTLGRVVDVSSFDAGDHLRVGPGGFARMRLAYDARGRRSEEWYGDAAGRPVNLKGDSYARIVYAYDERGNETERACFGADGKPVRCALGHHRLTKRHDDRGNHTESAFFGLKGEPVLGLYNAARIAWELDARGNPTRESYFDPKGQPLTAGPEGVARIDMVYDARNRRTGRSFFDPSGQRTLNGNKVSRVAWRYDDRGRQTEIAFYDTADRRTLNRYGMSRIATRYDDRSRVTAEDYFGVDDKPKENVNQVARMTYAYDERGRQTVRAFRADGRPR